ncbi:uncharacterized protein ACB058_015441 isoform 1-T1 [Synchiropus picturatus]
MASSTQPGSDLMMENLYNMVHSFFVDMDSEQWASLMAGNPDVNTEFKLAELLMNMVSGIAKSFLTPLENVTKVSEERVLAAVRNSVPQTFGRVFNIEEEKIKSDSTKNFVSLVAQEVTDSVKSSLSVPRQEPGAGDTSCRLSAMIKNACRMIKYFLSMVFSKPRSRRSKTASKKEVEVLTPLDIETEVGSMVKDDFLLATAQAVQEILLTKVREITEPLFGDLENGPEPGLLQSEFQNVFIDIARMIIQARRLEEVDSCKCTEDRQDKCFRIIWNRIRTIFGKYIFKALLRRCLAQVQLEFQCELTQENSQNFLSHVEMLIVPEQRQDKAGVEMVLETLKNVYSLKNIHLLSDLMFKNIQALMTPGSIKTPQEPDVLYVRIANRVRNILVLVKWWLKTQGDGHSWRLARLLMNTTTLGREDAPVTVVQELSEGQETEVPMQIFLEDPAREQVELNQVSLQIIVEKLVSHIYSQADFKWQVKNPEIIINKLFAAAWAEVQNMAFSVTPDRFERIVQEIFIELSKRWGTADKILVMMKMQKPELEEIVVKALKTQLLVLKNDDLCC